MLNQFEIVDKLGEGSYSSVYRVRRKADKRVYAMKKVNIPFLSDKERENALNEIRIIASVSHPNIIAYKECFYDSDHRVLCVIMEHADGGDLLQKIKYHREVRTFFQEAYVWNVFIQMVQALKALHDNQIVHRDLKSANILLCQDGRVKLADFNVSKIVKNNMTRTQIGTPFYASPEIWNFIPYDYKADMWSLGCIVYEMCCLRTPFQGKDMQQICRRVCRGVYQRIPNIYSKELWTMIQMLLQLAPELRPSCDSLLQDPFILNHIRQSQNQTLLFSTISENNCELLSTIQWSRTSASDTAQIKQELNTTTHPKQQLNIDEILSVRLPPPHYTPRSLEPKQYHTLKETNENYNPSKTQRKIIVSRRKINEKVQSRSVDEAQCNSPPSISNKVPYDQYMNNTIIQEEVDQALPKSKPKLQLRPLNNMAYQVSNRKLQVRTETSQTKRLKIFETPSLVQDSSRNSVEDLVEMPKPRKHRNSVAEKQQPKIYTSFDRQTEQATIQEEESDSDPKAKNKVQIKHIIDLLQGNPLRSVKVPPVQASKNTVPSKGLKNEAIAKSFNKQNVDEMKSIKTQMQDINRIIQQSISKREHQYQLLKK